MGYAFIYRYFLERILRRIVAASLLIAFLGQTSGSAVAATPETVAQMRLDLSNVVAPVLAAITDTPLWAALTGQQVRYEALHTPAATLRPKDFKHQQMPTRIPGMHPRPRFGGRRDLVDFPRRMGLHARPDPRAMRRGERRGRMLHSLFALGLGTRGGLPRGASRRNAISRSLTMSPDATTASGLTDDGAGAKPWWNFVGKALPGVGSAAVNVATGNVTISATDVHLPERGLDLDFTRIFNSQSLRDKFADDGSGDTAVYGNRWTSIYDAHMVYSPGQNGASDVIAIYDGTGTRWDYTADGNGGWQPPAGQHAVLMPSDSTDCSYWWIQPDGSAVWFHHPDGASTTTSCGTKLAMEGRVYEIVGRNANNYVDLNYTWTGTDPSGNYTDEYINTIDVVHSDGHAIRLTFGITGSTGCTLGTNGCWNELAKITRPSDGLTFASYSYDQYGNLTEVDKIGNDAAASLPQTYQFSNAGTDYMVCSPREVLSAGSTGACVNFEFDTVNRVTSYWDNAVLNFDPSKGSDENKNGDGGPTGTLQSGASGLQNDVNEVQFTYSSGVTKLTDFNGHATNFTIDGNNRVVATTTFTNTSTSPPSSPLSTSQTWNAGNQVTSATDARQLETDFAYDAAGNLIAQALPSQTNYTSVYTGTQTKPAPSAKTFRPTTRYSYQAYSVVPPVNNDPNTQVIAYNVSAVCDPVQSDNNGGDWTATPTTSQCGAAGQSNYTSLTYTHPSEEPNGELSMVASPKNEKSTITYPSGSTSDYGLPTSVTEPSITSGGLTFSQTIVASYNADGTAAKYSADGGAHYTVITYNGLREPVQVTDPTGVSSYACYNPDGSLSASTSPAQYAVDKAACGANSTVYTHDPDGNVTQVTRHWHNATAFHRWYDGLDRIVEASADGIGNADHWMGLKRRYLYDLSQKGAAAALGYAGLGSTFAAYGGLYKTQQCWVIAYNPNGTNQCGWNDMTAMAYDPVGRQTRRFVRKPGSYDKQFTPGSYAPGNVQVWKYAYDATPGMLDQVTKPDGTTVSYAYTHDGQVSSQTFADSATASEDTTSNLTYEFDADGRTVSAASAYFGADTYSFDYDGHLGQYAEGTAYNPDGEVLTYGYYANGWRQSLKIASPVYNETRTYAYDNAGRRTALTPSDYGAFTWTYDAGGRMLSQSDPTTGNAINCGNSCNTTNYPNGFTYGKKTISYNSAGQSSTLTFPDGTTFKSPPNTSAGITWDAENEPTAFGVGKPSGFAAGVSPSPYVTGTQIVYDARGELNTMSGTSAALSSSSTYETTENFAYFDGHPCMDKSCSAAATSSYFPMLDPYTGGSLDQGDNTVNPASTTCHTIDTLAYDSLGRNSSSSQVANTAGCVPTYTNFTRTYDAFDRTRSEIDSTNGTTLNTYQYAWGPTGNVRQFKSNGSTYTLHWDGSDLLFVTDGAGNVVQVDIEKLAATGWNASSKSMTLLQIYDRDLSGYAAATHTGKYDSGASVTGNHYTTIICGNRWSSCDPNPPDLIGSFPADGNVPPAPIITVARTDGYQAGSLTFQGVRTYDSQAGQWTTADHFLGRLEDPMSQYAYAWNGGNPITNQDPSGNSWKSWLVGVGVGLAVAAGVALVAAIIGVSAPIDATVLISVIAIDAVVDLADAAIGASVATGSEGLEAMSPLMVNVPEAWAGTVRAAQVGLGGLAGAAAKSEAEIPSYSVAISLEVPGAAWVDNPSVSDSYANGVNTFYNGTSSPYPVNFGPNAGTYWALPGTTNFELVDGMGTNVSLEIGAAAAWNFAGPEGTNYCNDCSWQLAE